MCLNLRINLLNMVPSLNMEFRSVTPKGTPKNILMWAYEKNDLRNIYKTYSHDSLICPKTPCIVTGNRSFLPSHDMFDAIGM